MEWKNLHFGPAGPLHAKKKVFSVCGLCFVFLVLLFYLFVACSSDGDNPATTPLFSWVSSSFADNIFVTTIDEDDDCCSNDGVDLEKTHGENLPGEGVVAGSVVKGGNANASSSLYGEGGPEEKRKETILSVGENQAFTVSDDMKRSVKDGRHFRNKLGGDEVVVTERCDIFDGRWVRDGRMPFYSAGSCPYIDKDFDCHNNGRPDSEFLNWRWQPNGCDIPRLNATDFLNILRGKRLIFVGDSLNRNMWESLVCILRHSVANKENVFEISGRSQFKTKGFYSFKFKDYNCSIEFVRSPFLVRESYGEGVNGTEDEKLRLDLLDETAEAYREANIIIFNTGHWWTHDKTSKGMNYYQEGDYVHPMLHVMEAYEKALVTWAKWVDENINPSKTRVVFRGYSLTHFSGGKWNSGGQCHKETEPITSDSFHGGYPSKMRVLESVLRHMKTPVMYLNISLLTDYRKDGHPSIYRMKYNSIQEQIDAVSSQDCSHWCLPGVPDTWNELLYASLLMDG